MSDEGQHVLAHVKPFGLHRMRAVCRCGYEAKPVEGTGEEADRAAREQLVTDHGARDLRPDEPTSSVLQGRPGSARPGPGHPWAPPADPPRPDRPRRLPW
jgi:hypothetical protein